MRTTFHQELSALSARVGDMCGLAAREEHRRKLLLGVPTFRWRKVIADREHVAAMQGGGGDSAPNCSQSATGAGDLRKLSALYVGADIERWSALRARPNIVRRRASQHAVPAMFATPSQMGTRASTGRRPRRCWCRAIEKAARLRGQDDVVDEHRHLLFGAHRPQMAGRGLFRGRRRAAGPLLRTLRRPRRRDRQTGGVRGNRRTTRSQASGLVPPQRFPVVFVLEVGDRAGGALPQ